MEVAPSPPNAVAGAAGGLSDAVHGTRGRRWASLALSIGALGVVYGDIGTSPLYTIQLIFTVHPLAPSEAHVYGALSLIFWSLVTVVTLKYVLVILRADNHGEGGIMALVALIQRSVTGGSRKLLVTLGVIGAALFYGDSMLTPAISVVSAVSGLQVVSPSLSEQVVPFSVAILVALFALQRFGAGAVGFLFGPIMLVWFAVLAALGAHQVASEPSILRALSPTYGGAFLLGEPVAGFLSLASVFLAVTGAEAIYADMGHFGRTAITRSWLVVAFPALMLNYLGQGALILRHPETVSNPFFLMVPGGNTGQTAMVILAMVATVIASQAVISGAFSVTQQLIQLGYLPRVTIRHTSRQIIGQIYIPLVNWLLLMGVLVLTVSFRNPEHLAAAYGVALSAIFVINTVLALRVFRAVWHKPLWILVPSGVVFLSIELTFFAANIGKLFSGGWLPLAVGAACFTCLTTWRRGRQIISDELNEGRVTVRLFLNRLIDEQPARTPGTAVFLSSSTDNVPQALLNNVEHNHVVPEQAILLTVKTLDMPHLPLGQGLIVRQLRLGFVSGVAQVGYQDNPDVPAALRAVRAQGVDVDPDTVSYYLNHVTLVPAKGRRGMARWRKALFSFLYRNATPAAHYFNLPPDRVVEVGAYVNL